MAGLALIACFLLQQRVVKVACQVEAFHAGMITVASHTVLADELLLKRRSRERLENGCALGGQTTDIDGLMATRALGRSKPMPNAWALDDLHEGSKEARLVIPLIAFDDTLAARVRGAIPAAALALDRMDAAGKFGFDDRMP